MASFALPSLIYIRLLSLFFSPNTSRTHQVFNKIQLPERQFYLNTKWQAHPAYRSQIIVYTNNYLYYKRFH